MNNKPSPLPTKPPRYYLPDDLVINAPADLEQYIDELKGRQMNSVEELENWLKDLSEVEAVVSEEMAWRYINTTLDTTDQKANERYSSFVREVSPYLKEAWNEFNHILLSTVYKKELDQEKYFVYLRSVQRQADIFTQENIPLATQLKMKEQEFAPISAAMTVEVNGEELTMQQANKLLKDPDRGFREELYWKIHVRRKQDEEKLNTLMDEQLRLRDQIARNAKYKNYRDYKHAELGRFDYSVEDCLQFHDSIEQEFLPLQDTLMQKRKEELKLDKLMPWDLEVDTGGKPPLKPFKGTDELITKSIGCFKTIRPYFGEQLEIMHKMGHFDLDSRKGKAPGGYNYPLLEIGVPFIFMNAVGSHSDLITMVHEGGHAIHSFLKRDLEMTAFKSVTSEVAELASMSMELLSMDHWDIFYQGDELRRAKEQQLLRVVGIFPWIATVDKFQHWMYTHPTENKEKRREKWLEIYTQYMAPTITTEGQEEVMSLAWQKQLHIFEVPFYYIEYAIAQLGALAIWQQYKKDPEKALDNYIAALKLGYTKPIKEIYETAGIKFDFSKDHIGELAAFAKEEIEKLS